MRYGIYLAPAAVVLTLGSLACKPPKTAEQIKAETQAAFNEGYQAFKDGKARATNPYLNDKENSHKLQGWYDGWDKAAEAERAAAFKNATDKALVNIHFDYDKAEIKESDRVILQGIADFMKAYPSIRLEIAGNCDERGTNEYNLALGNKRAAAALAYLKTLGVDEARFTTISYGKEKPLCTEAKEACWSQNRRGEFKLK